jgi:hypothetical protein
MLFTVQKALSSSTVRGTSSCCTTSAPSSSGSPLRSEQRLTPTESQGVTWALPAHSQLHAACSESSRVQARADPAVEHGDADRGGGGGGGVAGGGAGRRGGGGGHAGGTRACRDGACLSCANISKHHQRTVHWSVHRRLAWCWRKRCHECAAHTTHIAQLLCMLHAIVIANRLAHMCSINATSHILCRS